MAETVVFARMAVRPSRLTRTPRMLALRVSNRRQLLGSWIQKPADAVVVFLVGEDICSQWWDH